MHCIASSFCMEITAINTLPTTNVSNNTFFSFSSAGRAPSSGCPAPLARNPSGRVSSGPRARGNQSSLQPRQAGDRAGKDRAVGRHVSHGHAGTVHIVITITFYQPLLRIFFPCPASDTKLLHGLL